jgi:hypothetical protein
MVFTRISCAVCVANLKHPIWRRLLQDWLSWKLTSWTAVEYMSRVDCCLFYDDVLSFARRQQGKSTETSALTTNSSAGFRTQYLTSLDWCPYTELLRHFQDVTLVANSTLFQERTNEENAGQEQSEGLRGEWLPLGVYSSRKYVIFQLSVILRYEIYCESHILMVWFHSMFEIFTKIFPAISQ